ncbi:hypothetical protein AAHE18_11G034900 [Arachis hypogaea]
MGEASYSSLHRPSVRDLPSDSTGTFNFATVTKLKKFTCMASELLYIFQPPMAFLKWVPTISSLKTGLYSFNKPSLSLDRNIINSMHFVTFSLRSCRILDKGIDGENLTVRERGLYVVVGGG